MKTRRLSLVLMLVLLTALLLVAPVQAGRAVTGFTFTIPGADWDWDTIVSTWRDTGPVDHFVVVIKAKVSSANQKLNGGKLTLTLQDHCVTPNRHDIGGCWGPAPGKWQIVASAEGGALSGWEGTTSGGPWTDPRFPRMHILNGSGHGFGVYKNMHIDWTVKLTEIPGDWEFSGQISE